MDPFKIDGPTCLSFSAGRSSAYMLWRTLQSNDLATVARWLKVLFCNTGKEEEASLRFWRDCSDRWSIPIVGLEYQAGPSYKVIDFKSANRNGKPFKTIIEQRGGVLPNRVARYCSSEMKTRTMHRYLRDLGWKEWDSFIGIRADEPLRVSKNRANPFPESKDEEVHMPLAIAGISAKDVGAFWRSHPFDLGLPNHNGKTAHGNCDLCFLKPAAQVLSLIQEKPTRAVWWADQEKKAEKVATGSGGRFRDDRPSYAQMAQFTKDQSDAFDLNEEAASCFCGD